jgi:hypothetical protein
MTFHNLSSCTSCFFASILVNDVYIYIYKTKQCSKREYVNTIDVFVKTFHSEANNELFVKFYEYCKAKYPSICGSMTYCTFIKFYVLHFIPNEHYFEIQKDKCKELFKNIIHSVITNMSANVIKYTDNIFDKRNELYNVTEGLKQICRETLCKEQHKTYVQVIKENSKDTDIDDKIIGDNYKLKQELDGKKDIIGKYEKREKNLLKAIILMKNKIQELQHNVEEPQVEEINHGRSDSPKFTPKERDIMNINTDERKKDDVIDGKELNDVIEDKNECDNIREKKNDGLMDLLTHKVDNDDEDKYNL